MTWFPTTTGGVRRYMTTTGNVINREWPQDYNATWLARANAKASRLTEPEEEMPFKPLASLNKEQRTRIALMVAKKMSSKTVSIDSSISEAQEGRIENIQSRILAMEGYIENLRRVDIVVRLANKKMDPKCIDTLRRRFRDVRMTFDDSIDQLIYLYKETHVEILEIKENGKKGQPISTGDLYRNVSGSLDAMIERYGNHFTLDESREHGIRFRLPISRDVVQGVMVIKKEKLRYMLIQFSPQPDNPLGSFRVVPSGTAMISRFGHVMSSGSLCYGDIGKSLDEFWNAGCLGECFNLIHNLICDPEANHRILDNLAMATCSDCGKEHGYDDVVGIVEHPFSYDGVFSCCNILAVDGKTYKKDDVIHGMSYLHDIKEERRRGFWPKSGWVSCGLGYGIYRIKDTIKTARKGYVIPKTRASMCVLTGAVGIYADETPESGYEYHDPDTMIRTPIGIVSALMWKSMSYSEACGKRHSLHGQHGGRGRFKNLYLGWDPGCTTRTTVTNL